MFIVACCMWNKGIHQFNLGNFENNFFNFNKNGKGVQCKAGEFVYSAKADTFDVPAIIIFSQAPVWPLAPRDSLVAKVFVYLKRRNSEINI